MTTERDVVGPPMVRSLLARRPAASFVAVAFAVSWGVWIPAAQLLTATGPQFAAMVLGSFGPAVAGLAVVVARGGSPRAWVRDMAKVRISRRWYLAAIGLPLSFVVVETAVYAAVVGPIDPSTLPRRIAVWAGSFLVALVVSGGNEEPGWRGFLQPRLQRSHGALAAAVLVGAVWLVWHLPLDLLMPAALDGGGYDARTAISRLATLPLAIVYAWLYNASDGSVVVAMLFHAGWNTSQTLVPAPLPGDPGAGPVEGRAVLTATRVLTMLVLVVVLLVVYDRETLAAGDAHRQESLP